MEVDMSGLTDYAGYCTMKCEIDFSSATRDNGNLNRAILQTATQGVIWALYPSDNVAMDAANAFCITTSANQNNDPKTAVPLANLSMTYGGGSSYVTIDYDPVQALAQGTNKFYFHAYLWGTARALEYSNVTMVPIMNGNMSVKFNGRILHSQGSVPVTWIQNAPPSSSSARHPN
jgi:hypothetical protein